MGDPLSCASLIKLCLKECSHVRFLPLGNVLSLKYLHIHNCGGLLHLKRASLPSQLEHLTVAECQSLVEVALLKSLVNLHIYNCYELKLLSTTDMQMSELKSFPLLKKMTIEDCPLVEANQLLLGEDCFVDIDGCPNLKDRYSQHNFEYKELRMLFCFCGLSSAMSLLS